MERKAASRFQNENLSRAHQDKEDFDSIFCVQLGLFRIFHSDGNKRTETTQLFIVNAGIKITNQGD